MCIQDKIHRYNYPDTTACSEDYFGFCSKNFLNKKFPNRIFEIHINLETGLWKVVEERKFKTNKTKL